VTKAIYKEIICHNPYINKVHLLQKNGLNDLIKELKVEKFDYIIDLHKNFRSHLIRFALGIKSFSFNKLNFQKWLSVTFKINFLPEIHIVDRYFKAVEPLNVTNDQGGLDYFIGKEDELKSTSLLAETGNDYYAFIIGGKFFTKRYPAVKVASLCDQLKGKIVLLGGREDEETGNIIQGLSSAEIVNLCGKQSINESAVIIKNAKKVLSNDTGLMHIAAAFKKDIVSFWGSNIPEFGMYPYQTNKFIAEVKPLSCRPCSKLGKKKCPKGHFRCMNDIDQKAILQYLE
jgi:heptosyltransferase-2